jgi:hypothetical protein
MRKELTVRGLIIGIVITLVLTAANVYCGLKAGLTFSTSIPAAVISMALLRGFRDATIQENNIVQTVASAAGTLSSIIFVLPGFDHDRLVDRVSVLDLIRDLRARRDSRRDVFNSAAPRVGYDFRFAVSGRRRVRRSTEGRQWRRCQGRFWCRTRARRSACSVVGIDRVCRILP